MAPLKPPVPSSKARAENACALTSSSHYVWLKMALLPCLHHLLTCLLSCGPKSLRDVRGQCTATDSGSFPVLCDLNALKLVHPDFDSALHPPDCADGPMATVGGKEGYIGLRREFDLDEGKPLDPVIKEQGLEIHTVSATSLSVAGTTTTLTVGVSYDDHRDVAKSKAAVSLGKITLAAAESLGIKGDRSKSRIPRLQSRPLIPLSGDRF